MTSVTSIIYVPMSLWPSSAPFWQMFHSPILPPLPQTLPEAPTDDRS